MPTIRGIAREIERAERRHRRELERQHKEAQKRNARLAAEKAVALVQAYIEVLESMHKDCGPSWDWAAIRQAGPFEEPERRRNEVIAKAALDGYEPSFFAKVFGEAKRRREKLVEDVKKARMKDAAIWEKYEFQRKAHELSHGILSGDLAAYVSAVSLINPFEEFVEYGSEMEVRFVNSKVAEASFGVKSNEVVPKETLSVLKSGKLSKRNLPITRFYEIYQDYVCGGALRVARELMAALPLEMVIVTAMADVLNTSTGHLEEQPILSVVIPAETLGRFEFSQLDASDSMVNFRHNMAFKKTKGFEPVERIAAKDLEIE